MNKLLLSTLLLLLLTQHSAGAASIYGAQVSYNGATADGIFTFNTRNYDPDYPSLFYIDSIAYQISFNGWSLQAAENIEAGISPCPPDPSNPNNPCADYSDLSADSVTEIILTLDCLICNWPQINRSSTVISLNPNPPNPPNPWSNDNYMQNKPVDVIDVYNSRFAINENTVSGLIFYQKCQTPSFECPSYEDPSFSISINGLFPTPLERIPISNSLLLVSLGLVGLGLLRRRSV